MLTSHFYLVDVCLVARWASQGVIRDTPMLVAVARAVGCLAYHRTVTALLYVNAVWIEVKILMSVYVEIVIGCPYWPWSDCALARLHCERSGMHAVLIPCKNAFRMFPQIAFPCWPVAKGNFLVASTRFVAETGVMVTVYSDRNVWIFTSCEIGVFLRSVIVLASNWFQNFLGTPGGHVRKESSHGQEEWLQTNNNYEIQNMLWNYYMQNLKMCGQKGLISLITGPKHTPFFSMDGSGKISTHMDGYSQADSTHKGPVRIWTSYYEATATANRHSCLEFTDVKLDWSE